MVVPCDTIQTEDSLSARGKGVQTLRVVTGEDLPMGDDVLEFRLLYQGLLLGASRNDTRVDMKHRMRLQFHKQLMRLWDTKFPLKARKERQFIRQPINLTSHANPEDAFVSYHKTLADKFSYHGYSFIPIVTDDLFLTCSLEILFLRPEEHSLLVEGGDIDNRIKTVFDALRMPTVAETSDLKGKYPPTPDTTPMYCLMQDDKLVAEIKVTADQLLLLPESRELNANDVFLVVQVRVKPTRLTNGNLDFA